MLNVRTESTSLFPLIENPMVGCPTCTSMSKFGDNGAVLRTTQLARFYLLTFTSRENLLNRSLYQTESRTHIIHFDRHKNGAHFQSLFFSHKYIEYPFSLKMLDKLM